MIVSLRLSGGFVKKQFFKILIVSAFLVIPVITFPQQNEISIATNHYPPFVYKDFPEKGFFSQIINDCFKEMGFNVKYIYVPWTRCEYMVEYGQIFAAMPFTSTVTRNPYAMFSENVMDENSQKVISLKKISDKSSVKISDLSGKKIGAISGYYYIDWLDKNKISYDLTYGDDLAVRKLFENRYEAVIVNIFYAMEEVNKNYSERKLEIKIYDIPELYVSYSLMVSKKFPGSSAILNDFNYELKKYKKSKQYADIIKTYNEYIKKARF